LRSEEYELTRQLGGVADPITKNWPQYRKFSAAPCVRNIVSRTLIGAGVAGALVFSWMPSPERMLPPADMHVVTYVEFPRVEIVGKRENPATRTAAVSHGLVESVWIKFTKHGD
jgi:hypothetical protein